MSDREEVLAALQSSEERFRASVEHLHEALSVFTAVRDGDGGIVDFRWSYANPSASAITGYTADELEGRLLLEVLPDHGPSGMLDVYRHVVDTGEPYIEPSLWYEDVWGDGQRRRRAFDVRATKVQDGFVVVTREVTEERAREADLAQQRAEMERVHAAMLEASARDHRAADAEHRQMEARLQQSQRLESLGQLAGGVAHDFNNLLGAILNYSWFVAEALDRAGEPWVDVRRDVEQITRAAERAAALTRQLLAFGRREVVHPEVLRLNDVVADVEQLLRRTIGVHLDLATSLADDLWPIKADPGQIEQVLVNLAVNARDAMAGGGRLTIETTNVVIGQDVALLRPGMLVGRHVRLRVHDTGIGMDSDVTARAFEPFFTTKPKGEGIGLGLATVYGIVTQAGGHAEIHSEPGTGTTFTAFFPAIDDQPAEADRPVPPGPVTGRETVLLVEDEDAMREVTHRILDRNGYEVLATASGEEALEAARRHPGRIDVLLTDVVMPHMLGKEVAERVGQIRPGIKVLFVSGYAHPVLASQGTLEDRVDLLEKPFTASLLLEKLRGVLDTGR